MSFFYSALFTLGFFACLFFLYPNYKKKNSFFMGLIFLSIAFSLYFLLGDRKGLLAYENKKIMTAQSRDLLNIYKTPEQMILKMQTALEKDPNSAKGWFLLGRLYLASEQWALAKMAFEKSYFLRPEAETALQLSFALVQENPSHYSEAIKKQIILFSKRYPERGEWVVFLVNIALQEGKTEKAVHYLLQLKALSTDASMREEIDTQIQAIEKKAKNPFLITVDLSAEPSLKAMIPEDAVVFIVLKRLNGHTMPLAALKIAYSDLPGRFFLRGSELLDPDFDWNRKNTLKIIAKIALSGDPLEKNRAIFIEKKLEWPLKTPIILHFKANR